MNIQDIKNRYATSAEAMALQTMLAKNSKETLYLRGLVASSAPMLFATIAGKINRTILFVLNDNDEAGYFYNDLKTIIASESDDSIARVLCLPSSYKRSVKYGQRDSANEILRTEVMAALGAFDNKSRTSLFIVTEPSAIAELVVSKKRIDEQTISLRKGGRKDIVDLEKQLLKLGFRRVDYVYEPGHFALRGSILDVYSFSSELPFRIDFFGDEIDSIRTFDIENQLSLEQRERIEILPELSSTPSGKVPFFELLPKDALLVTKDFKYMCQAVGRIYEEGFSAKALDEQLANHTETEQQEIRKELQRELQLVSPTWFTELAEHFRRVEFGASSTIEASKREENNAVLTFDIMAQPLFHKNFELLARTLRDYIAKGYKLYILADSKKQTDRLHDIFDTMDSSHRATPIPFTPINQTLHEGFINNTQKECFFTDHQIFDRFHKYNLKSDKARLGKAALTMKELQEMDPGDFLVHIDFGIGKFAGLVRVPSGESYQEVIRLVYQRGDIVDVSIHSLYKISKYRRAESNEPPQLSVLGSGAWERLKEKAKKNIKNIARDLIKLYARRQHEKGFAFSPDSFMQHELEASFFYEDTPDQLKATNEIKQDMESSRPMDRLVCGDVGFGKTEVAIRAAFKAAADNKQVAVLVPTTVLAFQHYRTFTYRLENMPVRVDYFSRARTARQTKQVLTDLAEGKIDILIGTHKLISKNIVWKDLGLLIIDEEQKFGVTTKEKLRQLRTNIDTLTLSATPIPRTLQFSLMGARDMSIMRIPPPNRHPVWTEISTFSHEVIADAINFEMSRNGQTFIVNRRISQLPQLASMIKRYVPDCRVAIGHGQMKPEELEDIVMGFINHDYDVLVSTTIVENGVDIPNANTIIINDAHQFGLSDLHQMRGRVGRANKKAFCYLIAPPLAALSVDARRRLEALETFSELGSGFSIAMQDLDIRGAGNLLGTEQSGFMQELGYETYQKILRQAVNELRNDEFQDLIESNASGNSTTDFVDDCAIESDLEMYFPETYVPGSSERMLLYRELDTIECDDDLLQYRKRMEDRFGPIPKQGEELLQVVLLRRIGKKLGCEKIILKQNFMQLQFVSIPTSFYYRSKAFGKILTFITSQPRRCNLKEKNNKRSMLITEVPTVTAAVEILKEIESLD